MFINFLPYLSPNQGGGGRPCHLVGDSEKITAPSLRVHKISNPPEAHINNIQPHTPLPPWAHILYMAHYDKVCTNLHQGHLRLFLPCSSLSRLWSNQQHKVPDCWMIISYNTLGHIHIYVEGGCVPTGLHSQWYKVGCQIRKVLEMAIYKLQFVLPIYYY